MRPCDFDSLKPAEVGELIRTKRERDKQAAMQDDFRLGMVCATLANAHRDPKRKPQPFTPADFFPSLGRARRGRMSNEEIMAAARRIVGKPPPSKRKAST